MIENLINFIVSFFKRKNVTIPIANVTLRTEKTGNVRNKMVNHSELNWAKFIEMGKGLVGKKYKYGAEVNLNDPDPNHIQAIDCSELVEWLFANLKKTDGARAELTLPDGSYNQAKLCRHVDGRQLLIGDLGFNWWPDNQVIHHVGVYLGDDIVLEAKGLNYGVILTPKDKYMGTVHFAFWGRHPKIEDN